MAKFTKYNNPNKKRKAKRKLDYTERTIAACNEMVLDKQLGYDIPAVFYQEKYKLNGGK